MASVMFTGCPSSARKPRIASAVGLPALAICTTLFTGAVLWRAVLAFGAGTTAGATCTGCETGGAIKRAGAGSLRGSARWVWKFFASPVWVAVLCGGITTDGMVLG